MTRNQAVDFFKVIAIIAVISIHTGPFGDVADNEYYTILNMIINQTARFAVPFFFIISGYYWGMKVRGNQQLIPVTAKMIKRLFIVFIFWSFIYMLPYRPEHFGEIEYVYSRVNDIINNWVSAAFTGTRVHLWFLVSLGIAAFITALFVRFKAIKSLLILSVILYLLGLLSKAYSITPLGIYPGIPGGLLYSPIFFVTGYMLSAHKPIQAYLKYGILTLIIGIVVHFGELYYLYKSYGISPVGHGFLMGTYFMGLGVTLMALSDHPIFHIKFISILGKYVLGIYVIHMLFVDIFKNFDTQHNSPLWEISYIFIIFLISFFAVYLLSRFKIMKKVLI